MNTWKPEISIIHRRRRFIQVCATSSIWRRGESPTSQQSPALQGLVAGWCLSHPQPILNIQKVSKGQLRSALKNLRLRHGKTRTICLETCWNHNRLWRAMLPQPPRVSALQLSQIPSWPRKFEKSRNWSPQLKRRILIFTSQKSSNLCCSMFHLKLDSRIVKAVIHGRIKQPTSRMMSQTPIGYLP